MTPTKSGWTTTSYIQAAMTLYGVAATIYAIYTSMESLGIAGLIAAKQMEWFGSSSFALTFCLVLVVIGLIPFLVLIMLGVTVFPAAGEAIFGSATSTKPRVPAAPPAPFLANGLSWPGIFKTAVVLFGLTGAAAAVTYFLNVREQGLGIYRLDLDKPGGALPGRTGFVQLTGHLRRQYVAGYRDNDTMHLIVAMTDDTWTPNVPVRFFVHYEQFGTDEKAFAPPQEFRKAGATEIGGRFSGKLPVFAERGLEKKGIKIDKDYRILNWERIPTGGAPQSDSHWIVLGVGGICSLALAAAMVGIKLRQPKRA